MIFLNEINFKISIFNCDIVNGVKMGNIKFNDWWYCKEKIIEKNKIFKLYKLFYRRIMRKNAACIMPYCFFATKPNLPHGLSGIFISSGSKIGKNAVIFQQVTIGSVTTIDSKNHGSPTIGDNCYIGAGAKIIGKITIGDNVRIGANCVVHKSVPSNSIVIGGEQRVIELDNLLDNKYYFNRNGVWFYSDCGEFKKCPNNGEKPSPY